MRLHALASSDTIDPKTLFKSSRPHHRQCFCKTCWHSCLPDQPPIYDVRLIGFKCTGWLLLRIFAWFGVQTHNHCNARVLDVFGGSDSADTQFGLEICAAKGVEETGLLRDIQHLARGFIALGGLQVDMRLDRICGSWLAGAA